MTALAATLRELYGGDTRRAHRFRYALLVFDVATIAFVVVTDLTGWLWTGLIERISQDRRSRTCGEVRRRARSMLC
jgi:hypothetical protein